MERHATDPDHLPSLPGLLTTNWANATAAGAATAAGTRGRHHGSHTKDVWQPLWQPLGLNTLCQCNIMKQHATDPDHLPSLPGLLTTNWANALTEPTTHSDAGHTATAEATARPSPPAAVHSQACTMTPGRAHATESKNAHVPLIVHYSLVMPAGWCSQIKEETLHGKRCARQPRKPPLPGLPPNQVNEVRVG